MPARHITVINQQRR